MKSNMSGFDGALRTLLFILSIIYVIALGGSWLWLIPGVLFFAIALVGWCPLYAILGVDNSKLDYKQ